MLWVKTQGTWKEAHQVQVRVDGAQRSTQDVWVKKDGTWHSTCQYIVRVTGRVAGGGMWAGANATMPISLRPDGSPYPLPGWFHYAPSAGHRPLPVGHRSYRQSIRNLGACFAVFMEGSVSQINTFNSFKGFRWLGSPWLPLSGGAVADYPENYPKIYLPVPPASSAALNAHFAKNINQDVTLYFR